MSLSLKSSVGSAIAGALVSSFIAVQAHAEPPPEGSEQWNLLSPYKDFITNMNKPDGSVNCCNMADGRGDLKERFVDGQLQVFITRELYPNAGGTVVTGSTAWGYLAMPFLYDLLPPSVTNPEHSGDVQGSTIKLPEIPKEGMWIDVPEADILSPKEAFKICQERFKGVPLDKHSCHQPPFNVLWLNIRSLKPFCYIRRNHPG